MPTKVSLRLETLTCGSETEGGSEPYIWPIYVAEEGGAPILHIPGPELAGKVLKSQLRSGESVAIPNGMNSLEHVFDNVSAGLVVLIVALFEKDSSPIKGTRAVLNHIGQRSFEFVLGNLALCRQSNGQRNDLRKALLSRFDLAGAERGALSITEQIATKFSSGGFDDSVGFAVLTFSGAALTTRDLTFNLSSLSEQFSLTGSLRLSLVLAARCQAERAALEQAEAVVKGLQSQRQLLQKQLQTATPQQKPAIIAQIKKIAEVDLPPAEVAVVAAKAALDACLAQSPHGPLDHPIVIG